MSAVAGKHVGKKGKQFLVRHKERAPADKEVWEIWGKSSHFRIVADNPIEAGHSRFGSLGVLATRLAHVSLSLLVCQAMYKVIRELWE